MSPNDFVDCLTLRLTPPDGPKFLFNLVNKTECLHASDSVKLYSGSAVL